MGIYDHVDADPTRPQAMSWDVYAATAAQEWAELLGTAKDESDLHSFLEQNPSFIPGGDGNVKIGGNHGTAAFSAVYSEPVLQGLKTRRPDFMWVTKSSATLEPVCIEIERAAKHWFNPDGQQTAAFTQAHTQLAEWKAWFNVTDNEGIFRRVYVDDWGHLALRPAYVLGYGRTAEFAPGGRHKDPKYMLAKRAGLARDRETLMSLDNFKPSWWLRHAVALKMTESGPGLWALPRTFETGPAALELMRAFPDPSKALERSTGWTDERRAYVENRWKFWRDIVHDPDDDVVFVFDPAWE